MAKWTLQRARYVLTRKASILMLTLLVFLSIFAFLDFSAPVRSYAASDSDLYQSAVSFLERVAGMNLSIYTGLSPRLVDFTDPRSVHTSFDVDIVLGNKSDGLSTNVGFFDGKIWGYKLYLPSQHPEGGKTLNDCLAIASRTIDAYGELCNVTYSQDVASMISAAMQGQNLTVENDRALLTISCDEGSYGSFTRLGWYKKIGNGSTTEYQSIGMTLSKDGLLIHFEDTLAAYHVVTTSVNVSEADVINVSKPYAEANAKSYGLEIVSSEARLEWWRDYDFMRGNDEFAVYPMWVFTSKYNSTAGIVGYGVEMWADNGQIFDKGVEGEYGALGSTSAPTYAWLLLTVIPAVAAVACLGTYLRLRKKKKGDSK